MSRAFKNEKKFKKFKKNFSFIFNNQNIIDAYNKSIDKNGAFIAFLLALIVNRIGEEKAIKIIKINTLDWINFFMSIYKNNEIEKVFKDIELNPVVDFEKLLKYFDFWDPTINDFLNFLDTQNIDLNIDKKSLFSLIKCGFSYLLYNKIDVNIPYKIEQIIVDKNYEQKCSMAIYNTKLFSLLKSNILKKFGSKINDFIVLILGMSKALSLVE